jgi:methylated-DNA-[protein]-cysteine S-methyltransferase
MTTAYTLTPSPIDDLLVLVDDDRRVTGCYVAGQRGAPSLDPAWVHDPAACRKVTDQLDAYFAGDLVDFDLDLAPAGTAFQRQVWDVLATIGFGQTWSYGQVAEQVGRPRGSRAVGQANGRNPISIILPCHRVIAADGSLGGYGWGLPRKRWLLDHESQART